jgi:hypothetical protein
VKVVAVAFTGAGACFCWGEAVFWAEIGLLTGAAAFWAAGLVMLAFDLCEVWEEALEDLE